MKPRSVSRASFEVTTRTNPVWNESAFVYAIDSSTIRVSGQEIPEWKEISCLREKINIHETTGKLVFQIPESFWRFSNLERKHRVVSLNGNNLLITVSGNIIEEKKYPS